MTKASITLTMNAICNDSAQSHDFVIVSPGRMSEVTSPLELSVLMHETMLTNQKKTKKTLQELSRVFNKLASELTSDLNEAMKEIESLKREIRSIKSNRHSFGATKTINTKRRSPSHGKPRTAETHSTHTGSGVQSSTSGDQPSHHATASKDETPYVFPQEPYNPPAPPEPTLPGNN